jgi:hypothetical protein
MTDRNFWLHDELEEDKVEDTYKIVSPKLLVNLR